MNGSDPRQKNKKEENSMKINPSGWVWKLTIDTSKYNYFVTFDFLFVDTGYKLPTKEYLS